MKYIADKITHYDSEKQLHSCYVGGNKPNMPLSFTCWGVTSTKAKAAAKGLANLLNLQK